MKENQFLPLSKAEEMQQSEEINACCFETIKELAENNPMMACQKCENIIKRFEEQSAFEHYAKFCHSRRRKIQKASYKNYKIILFKKH